ncbi:MAG: hypothetical protein ACREP6_09420 [Candidatus Binataceae bacterium]
MKITHLDKLPTGENSGYVRHRGGGLDDVWLLSAEEGSVDDYRLGIARASEEFFSPRHRHNFDQIRFNLAGLMNYGARKFIKAGDIGYFPEGTAYGPQAQSQGEGPAMTMIIQFGGASRGGMLSNRQISVAFEALKKLGRFEKGIFYQSEDAKLPHKTQIDAAEAIWEYTTERPLEFPKPRYEEPVIIYPENFAWQRDIEHPGAMIKKLGSFGELSLEISMLKLAGAELPIPPRAGRRLFFVIDGEGTVDGEPFRRYSAFEVPKRSAASIASKTTADLLMIGMPIFDMDYRAEGEQSSLAFAAPA